MRNKKFKTSTRISIIFSIFTFFIIFSLLIILNIYLFSSWYNKEIEEVKESNEVTDILNIGFKEVISDEVDNDKENKDLLWLLDIELFEEKEINIIWYSHFFLDLYIKNNKIYLILQKENKNFYSPFDVSKYFFEQLQIIKIWLILLMFFTFLSYIVSKKLFIKLALKDIFKISDELKNINLNKIEKLKNNLQKDDEINIIVDSLNNFLSIIDKNHKSLTQFNTQVAHEFKTPLMVISSELEFLELEWEQNDSMKRINFQIQKLDSLLNHFLLLTKINSKKTIEIQEINLYNIIEENILEIEKKYKQKNILIKNKISKKINITTNKWFFGIIIKNIIDNAFKYNNENWEIKINFKENKLTISDTWKWIKKGNIEKIWDNLYREDEFSKWYWVWLNLVKKVCEVLDYKISVESIEGKWTKFILKLK